MSTDGGLAKHKKAKYGSTALVASTMNIVEKNTLMLVLILVHECDHLLNGLFSTVVKLNAGKTPSKRMSVEHNKDVTDVGHIMEREMYGFVIQHGFDELLHLPFMKY